MFPLGVEWGSRLWNWLLWAAGAFFPVLVRYADCFMDTGLSFGWIGMQLSWRGFVLHVAYAVCRNIFLEKEERRTVG